MLGTPRIVWLTTALLLACSSSNDSERQCEPEPGWDSESDSDSEWDTDSDSTVVCDPDTPPPRDCPERAAFEHPDPFVAPPPVEVLACADPVVEDPELIIEGELESWDLDNGTDSFRHVEGRCSWPLETCGTWSDSIERASTGRCLGSATLTGCAADRYVREGDLDVFTRYYGVDGGLLAVHHISDTDVSCQDPDNTTAWEAWLGPFIDGCVETDVRASAGCIPRTMSSAFLSASGDRASTLDDAIARVATGCYGLATCQDECGPASVVFVAGTWRGDGDELEAAHYDLSGQRIGDGLAIPRACLGAVLTPSAGCGLVGDAPL